MRRRIRQILPAPAGQLVRLECWVDDHETWSGWTDPVVFVALVEHDVEDDEPSQTIEPVTWAVEYEEYLPACSLEGDRVAYVASYVSPDLAWEQLIGHLQQAVSLMAARRIAARRRQAKEAGGGVG